MADNAPNIPGDGVPPKPSEAAKVQPKKETVRISLPPKPTASPTIKLPTLPGAPAPGAAVAPGAPTTATSAPTAAAPPPPPSRPATAAPGSRLASAPAAKAAAPASTASKAGAPAPAPQKAVAPVKPAATVGVFDKVLAIVAFVGSGAALGTTIYLMVMLNEITLKYQELAESMPKPT